MGSLRTLLFHEFKKKWRLLKVFAEPCLPVWAATTGAGPKHLRRRSRGHRAAERGTTVTFRVLLAEGLQVRGCERGGGRKEMLRTWRNGGMVSSQSWIAARLSRHDRSKARWVRRRFCSALPSMCIWKFCHGPEKCRQGRASRPERNARAAAVVETNVWWTGSLGTVEHGGEGFTDHTARSGPLRRGLG